MGIDWGVPGGDHAVRWWVAEDGSVVVDEVAPVPTVEEYERIRELACTFCKGAGTAAYLGGVPIAGGVYTGDHWMEAEVRPCPYCRPGPAPASGSGPKLDGGEGEGSR